MDYASNYVVIKIAQCSTFKFHLVTVDESYNQVASQKTISLND